MKKIVVAMGVILASVGVLGCQSGDRGKELFESKCTRCHDLGEVVDYSQKVSSRADWGTIVDRMMNRKESKISAGEAEVIKKFLERTYH